ncbi:galactokinase [Erysipelothrix larvae]|uniref:Galactokinase n=1 Tax=Erysipelothrix larvae TaxID=1514105 RepID=A0A0X8H0F4_9FIRM|nr:galactokinase [Erysipelothrix larvae]AMC93776.1 galactokinase [Erysipelothrix larvae]
MGYEGLKQVFQEIYKSPGERVFFAPGRINLIGEHIDYNGGNVFPCAIDLGTYAVVKKREDRIVRFYSTNMPEKGVIEISLDDLSYNKEHGWTNYPKGVLYMLAQSNKEVPFGFDIAYEGNIPNGSGLSSSASISVLTCWVVNELYNLGVQPIECAQIVQKTENEYLGVSTGIMDQFAITMGKEKYAMLLDTSDLSYQYVPFDFEDATLLIMNTCKRRELIESAYNTRRDECEQALKIVREVYAVDALCSLSLVQLEAIQNRFEDETIYKRARHAVSENERTHKAVDVLTLHDANAFGELMNQSHTSLRDDYEVTGIELDTLVQTAQSIEGTYGARVTGAGFGGCSIALVKHDAVSEVIQKVRSVYVDTIGYEPAFYTVTPSRGVHEIIE